MIDTIFDIRAAHRRRVYAMDQRKRADQSLGAFLRVVYGWRKDLPEQERDKIATRAAGLMKAGNTHAKAIAKAQKAGSEVEFEPADPDYWEWSDVILATIKARAPFDMIEKQATDEMAELATTLPVWKSFAKHVCGFGAVSLAVIIAEAGDLSEYPTHSALWKRMGLAVMGRHRQGGLPKGAPASAWIEHGYSRKRRSLIWVIGDVLVKVNGDGEYRQTYLARKAYEKARAEAAGLKVVPAAKIPKGREAEFMSEGHVHRRAQRYMEKLLLRHLWQEWKRAISAMPGKASQRLPASIIDEGDHMAA